MISLRTLGKAEIVTATDRVTPSQEIVFAAGLYLFLERGKRIPRAALAEVLWPGIADSPRQHRLRQTLHQLKQAGIPLEANRESVSLATNTRECDLDVVFMHGAGDIDALESLQFLPGYEPTFSRAFTDWLDAKRGEVSAAVSRLLINDIRRARARGDWSRVERLALKCMDVDPFNEEAVLARAEASAMRGAKREAVSILDRYVADLGPGSSDIKLPATLMRKRIAERVSEAAVSDRSESIFVGREADMQALTVLLEDARHGRGRCCLIWGDAGIGKSRLASELGRFGELQGVQLRRVACRRGDAQRPLSVFVEAVPILREMRGALGCSADTMADLKRLTQFDATGGPKQAMEMDPQSIFELIRLAIFDLIDAVSEEQCLMLLVEDVHWLDAASARILGQIADWAAKKHLLLVFTSRARENPLLDACTRAGLITHHLSPLSDIAATALVTEMFDATNEKRDDEFFDWCRTVGDGNPFFLHELVKQWLETKQRQVMPPSITTVIRDRFSRLSTEATQLLQACSILGENSTLPRVEKMLQPEPYRLLGALNELSKASMLSAERKPIVASGNFRLAARHDLVSVVAMEEMDPHAKIFLHRRAGDVLEAELDAGADAQDTSLMWACAQHWQKAGEQPKALELATQCAEHLLRVGLPGDAASAFRKAREFAQSVSDLLLLGSSEIKALEFAQAWIEVQDLVLNLRRNSTDHDPHDDFELHYLNALWRTSTDITEPLNRLLECVASSTASTEHRIRAGCMALKMASNDGRWSMLDELYKTLQTCADDRDVPQDALSEFEMVYHTMRGELTVATTAATQFLIAVTRSGNVNQVVRALVNVADVYRLGGLIDKAYGAANEAVELATANRCSELVNHTALALVSIDLSLWDLKTARKRMDRITNSGFHNQDPIAIVKYESLEAQLLIEEERFPEAREICHALQAKLDWLPAPRIGLVLATATRLEVKDGAQQENLLVLVEKLLQNHLAFRATGWQDYEAYSLYLGQSALGNERDANILLSEYARSYRRDLSRLPDEIELALSTAVRR